MIAAEQSHLTVVEPVDEPIVLVIEGHTHVVKPDETSWPIAWYARERDQALKLAERDLRAKRTLIANLRKSNEDEAEKARQQNPDRPAVERIFDRWRTAGNKPRCKLTPERFDMTVGRLAEGYDEAALTMAAVGVAVCPYIIEGERKDDYKTAMQSGEQVERYANRCPPAERAQIKGECKRAGRQALRWRELTHRRCGR